MRAINFLLLSLFLVGLPLLLLVVIFGPIAAFIFLALLLVLLTLLCVFAKVSFLSLFLARPISPLIERKILIWLSEKDKIHLWRTGRVFCLNCPFPICIVIQRGLMKDCVALVDEKTLYSIPHLSSALPITTFQSFLRPLFLSLLAVPIVGLALHLKKQSLGLYRKLLSCLLFVLAGPLLLSSSGSRLGLHSLEGLFQSLNESSWVKRGHFWEKVLGFLNMFFFSKRASIYSPLPFT